MLQCLDSGKVDRRIIRKILFLIFIWSFMISPGKTANEIIYCIKPGSTAG